MKPETQITASWGASTPQSGSISKYELRYSVDGGSTFTVVSNSISASTRSYSFTPSVREGQTLLVQVRAVNSYSKASSWGNFTTISIYADGMSVGKIGGNMVHLRAYVKVNGSMKKIKFIKVKRNGLFYSIDQYNPPV